MRPAGFEPATSDLGNRCSENSSLNNTDTYESTKTQLTPQLTPKSQKQGKIDTQNLSSNLAEVIAVWPELPEHIKAAIKALIHTQKKGEK
ncbi:MAG: hypothetical protein A2173_00850 [Planctomycetes bacterium RBG_13_44_8b]|nr:MAG: hypothetical protein A2173_00850 [Planctomycetes bacterium RBG_13_44_8b]